MVHFRPLIVIGAARSGTKLLRDTLAHHPHIAAVPYDINYVWRLGNEHIPHDALSPLDLTPHHAARIRQQIGKYRGGRSFLVEKTVSNCLRIPYIEGILPDAFYIHLVRDGRDVVESVARQWTAKPDWRYIWQKARAFPLLQAPSYAVQYALASAKRLMGTATAKTTTWGPRYPGIDEDVAQRDLLEVCAIQWQHCTTAALEALANIPSERQISVHYEDFVKSPAQHVEAILTSLGVDPDSYPEEGLVSISPLNVGKGRQALSAEQLAKLMPYLEVNLERLGYLQTV